MHILSLQKGFHEISLGVNLQTEITFRIILWIFGF